MPMKWMAYFEGSMRVAAGGGLMDYRQFLWNVTPQEFPLQPPGPRELSWTDRMHYWAAWNVFRLHERGQTPW